MAKFEDTFKAVYRNASGEAGAQAGNKFVGDVKKAIDETVKEMTGLAQTDQKVDIAKGFVPEAWTASTFNVDKVRQGKTDVWAKRLHDNSPVDIQYGDTNTIRNAQLKYYKLPEATAKQISDDKYAGMTKVGPSDQINGIKEEAYRQYLKNRQTHPGKAHQYRHTSKHVTDHIEHRGVQSKSLSEREAIKITRELKRGKLDLHKHGLAPDQNIEVSDIMRESGEAALYAALFTAAIKAAPHIWNMIDQMVREGEIKKEELLNMASDVSSTSAEAGLRAAIAAAITASCKSGMLGPSFVNLPPSAIAGATVMALNSMKYAFQMYQGKISGAQFASLCLRDSMTITAGVLGGMAGQTLIPIPVLGALIGNILGSLVGAFIYQGCDSIIISVCVDKGWTFLGLVEQDYTIPENILRASGLDIFDYDRFKPDSFVPDKFQYDKFEPERMDFVALRRGVIQFRKVGYV